MGDVLRRELTSQQAERLLEATLSKVLAASIRHLLQPPSSLRTILLDGPDFFVMTRGDAFGTEACAQAFQTPTH